MENNIKSAKAWLFKGSGYRTPPPLDSEAYFEKNKKNH